MEINITNIIEKTIKDLIKGTRGEQIAKLYRKNWNIANYAIIAGIGVLINYVVQAPLQGTFHWMIANALGIFTAFLWNWINSVGPFGYMWGFGKKGKRYANEPKVKTKTPKTFIVEKEVQDIEKEK